MNITPKRNDEGEALTYTFGTNFVHGGNNNNNNNSNNDDDDVKLVFLLHPQKQPQLSSGSLSFFPSESAHSLQKLMLKQFVFLLFALS